MQFLDLTMHLNDTMSVYPGDVRPIIEHLESDGIKHMRLVISSHHGTHIDAPAHMIPGGKTLSDFPITALVGEGIVIDLHNKLGYELIKPGDIVFLFTNHTSKIYTHAFYENNPVMSEEIARMLVDKKVKMVGIDSYSIDNPPFPSHRILLGSNILIVENLVNLKTLVGKRFRCYALPLNLDQADGSPCRVIAIT